MTITFNDHTDAFAAWLRQDDDDIHDTARHFAEDLGGMLRGVDDFWGELVTLFEHVVSDDTSPLKPAAGANLVSLVREYNGDGGVCCCLATLYVGDIKLATRALDRRELSTPEHPTGVNAAAYALAAIASAIDCALEPFAALEERARGDKTLDQSLRIMRAAISDYGQSDDRIERLRHASVAIAAATSLDEAMSNGRGRPEAWIDPNAEAIRVSVLANARAEAEMAHRYHTEAAAEVDRLTAERRELWRTNSKLQQEILDLRKELAETSEGLPSKFTHDDLKTLIRTAVELWDGGDLEDLSVRQRAVMKEAASTVSREDDEDCETPDCETPATEGVDDSYDGRCGGCADLLSALDADFEHDHRTRAELEADYAKQKAEENRLTWEPAETPCDERATSRLRALPPGVTSAYYQVGPESNGNWSLTYITNGPGGVGELLLGIYADEDTAKNAARLYENGETTKV